MNPAHKTRKQQILSDPVAVYTSSHDNTDAKTIAALDELRQAALALQQQRDEIDNQAKALSRQIGETKRCGKPIETLKLAMQQKSGQLRQLDAELGDIEQRILHFFDSENTRASDAASTATDASEPPAQRTYPASAGQPEAVSISLLEDEEDAWNAYVASNPAATIHHRTEWRELLRETYAIESFYFMARDHDGRIVGILPLTRLQSRLFGDLLVSMPYFQRGGAVADHPLIEQKLMRAAEQQAAELGVDHIEYRDDIPRQAMPLQSHKVNMVLRLPGTSDSLWQGFSSKLRAQIRRAQREQPQVLLGHSEHLDDFYRVYSRNMRDLGSPVHSKRFVASILERFPANSWIIVLRLHNRPVAAGLLLSQGDTLEIPLASTIREANPLSMNMLLYWEVLKFACQEHFHYFDFGRSSKAAGTYRFKQQWGAQPKQLYWHYWLGAGGELPSLNPSNPKYALMITIWKQLPVFVTQWLGPLIVKNIP